jgi:hypothetical protein
MNYLFVEKGDTFQKNDEIFIGDGWFAIGFERIGETIADNYLNLVRRPIDPALAPLKLAYTIQSVTGRVIIEDYGSAPSKFYMVTITIPIPTSTGRGWTTRSYGCPVEKKKCSCREEALMIAIIDLGFSMAHGKIISSTGQKIQRTP